METPEINPEDIVWEEVNVDLSMFTYPEFLAFLFDRPVVAGVTSAYRMFHKDVDSFDVSDPAIVVGYLTAMCTNFVEISRTYSPGKIEQGLWAVWGSPVGCPQYLLIRE